MRLVGFKEVLEQPHNTRDVGGLMSINMIKMYAAYAYIIVYI